MKRILLLLILTISINFAIGQRGNADKIKAMKTAFITSELDLSPKEAQQFWPIYNKYDKIIFNARVVKTRSLTKKIRLAGGVENLKDSEANEILDAYINIDSEIADAKQELRKNLEGVISGKKMIKLFKAEQDFNKRLLREFRNRRKN